MERKTHKKEFYTSPEVEVVEMRPGQIICVSGNTDDSYFGETEEIW